VPAACHAWGMVTAASPLSAKQFRTINYALSRLAGAKSFIPIRSIEDFRKVPFGHELQLSGNRIVLLSDYGMEQVRLIVRTLREANLFEGLADYSDLWSACWKTLEELLSKNQIAESANEWFELISTRIRPQIQLRIFVVPFVGVEFKDIDEFPLGSMKLLRPDVRHLEAAGVDHGFADVPKIIRRNRNRELWLKGGARGTRGVAEKRFRTLSDLVAGLLAVAAAAMLNSGATKLFISANMTGHDSHGDATWFSWEESGSSFSLHRSGIRGVPFIINADLSGQFSEASVIATVMRIFESESRTPLEEAIVRGFHWFADAQRDPTSVMQFVKYWSCVETFFSSDQADITRSVSVGMAAVLVFGGYGFVRVDDYSTLKKRIAKLYALRSKAVHRALRSHITELDVGELSHRVAQLLINAVSFVERGYRTPDEIKRHSERLDGQIKQVRKPHD
jgi:hypothetical protein